ncbi:hypothetical protein GH714_002837 [Hevea brasiliensis]|uniref:Uncharacterized protein n=1 Tax=Hevea brasiliensis TaxID=3981 RepID=A0A6A6MAD2_HEVBR|nr:hypothetical protein GH714_002837 [Hevea brasiliensis]
MSNTSLNCTHQGCPYTGDNLNEAAERGRFNQFKEHLDHLDSIVAPDGNTILHIHLSYQREISTDFIKQVVFKCPRLLSQENCDGNTPLHIAASHGYTDVVEELIRLAEALLDALDTQSGEVAIKILDNEEDIQSGEMATERAMKAVREMLRKVNKKGETALHVAARNGRSLGIVKAILSKEDPQFTYSANNDGETPLYLAFDNTWTNIVAELLNNPNSQSLDYRSRERGDTVLHTAVKRWDTEIVCMLLEKQSSLAKIGDVIGMTPLHYAALQGSSSMVATLLDKDKSIACIASELQDITALHLAAIQGHKHAMNEIISKCQDCCKLTDRKGNNVLHHAVYSKSEEVLRAILENSSLISLIIRKDNDGNTPVRVFKGLNIPLPSFILDGNTDAFILWKKLYYEIPKDFTIKSRFLWDNEDTSDVMKPGSE